MITVAITGSIATGKSTIAKMFSCLGIAVYDADAAVHELYKGNAVSIIESEFPGTVIGGRVNRYLLGKKVLGKPEKINRLEKIIHPLVFQKEKQFLEKVCNDDMAVFEIPLLFETESHQRFDKVITVTTSLQEQRKRVLRRPYMDEKKFGQIISRQISDQEKCKRSDFIIDTSDGDTSQGLKRIFKQVKCIIRQLRNSF